MCGDGANDCEVGCDIKQVLHSQAQTPDSIHWFFLSVKQTFTVHILLLFVIETNFYDICAIINFVNKTNDSLINKYIYIYI